MVVRSLVAVRNGCGVSMRHDRGVVYSWGRCGVTLVISSITTCMACRIIVRVVMRPAGPGVGEVVPRVPLAGVALPVAVHRLDEPLCGSVQALGGVVQALAGVVEPGAGVAITVPVPVSVAGQVMPHDGLRGDGSVAQEPGAAGSHQPTQYCNLRVEMLTFGGALYISIIWLFFIINIIIHNIP